MTVQQLAPDDGLNFPAWLLAKPGRRRREAPVLDWAPLAGTSARPEGKRWARAERFRIHLNDQALRIGSGQRNVWAIVGRKWVGLSTNGAKQVIPREAWNILARKAVLIVS